MKKLAILLVMLFLLLACGNPNPSNPSGGNGEKTVELDFWTFWGSELRRPIIERIIDDFNEENENIKVKHTYNPYGDIWTKELAAIAAGNPPDVVINDINATAIRGQKQRAENLADFIDDKFSEKYFPYLWDAMIYEDGVYGIPFTTDTRVLFYNKDLFKEAGLDPDRPPKTWDELIEFGNKLDKKNDSGDYDVMGFYPLYNVGPDVWIINANGKNYLDKDGKANINTDINKDVLNWLIERRNHYGKDVVDRFQSKVDGDQSHPFLRQELAMLAGTGTFYKQIKDYAQDFELGVAVLPEYKEGSGHTSWGGGFVVEIPFGAKNKEESWKFIEYLTEKHAQILWGALNFDNVAHIEASEAVSQSNELNERDQEVYKVLDENMKHTILTPTPVKMPNYFELVNPVLEDIILGRKDIEKGLESIQKQLEDLYNENS